MVGDTTKIFVCSAPNRGAARTQENKNFLWEEFSNSPRGVVFPPEMFVVFLRAPPGGPKYSLRGEPPKLFPRGPIGFISL